VLGIAIDESRRTGDPETQVQSLQAEIDKRHVEIVTELKRLACEKSGDEVRAVPVPAIEVIESFRVRFDAADQQMKRIREKRRDIEREQSQVQRDLAKSETSGSTPRPDDLFAARRHRDCGWRSIRRVWLSGTWDPTAATEFDGDAVEPDRLARAYEEAVDTSDDIADRLAAQADRVRARLDLEVKLRSHEEQLKLLGEDEVSERAAFVDLQKAWQLLWVETATTPQSPLQMTGWRQSWELLRDRIDQVEAKKTELTRTRSVIATLSTRLRTALNALGENETTLKGIASVADLTRSQYAHSGGTRKRPKRDASAKVRSATLGPPSRPPRLGARKSRTT
jgi:hypothetical protein